MPAWADCGGSRGIDTELARLSLTRGLFNVTGRCVMKVNRCLAGVGFAGARGLTFFPLGVERWPGCSSYL
jgi:hypothetical protein